MGERVCRQRAVKARVSDNEVRSAFDGNREMFRRPRRVALQLQAARREFLESGRDRSRKGLQPFVFDFSTDATGETAGVEGSDPVNAGKPTAGFFECLAGIPSQGGDHTITGDHHSAFCRCVRHLLSIPEGNLTEKLLE